MHSLLASGLIDHDGIIRDHTSAKGYEQSERLIQPLLGLERELVSVEGVGVEAVADWDRGWAARPLG